MIKVSRNKQLGNLLDISLNELDSLKKFNSIEIHSIFYPLSRNFSSEDFSAKPFEEYVKDVVSNNRSAYQKIRKVGNKFFGIFTAAVITTVFLIFDKKQITSIEAIASIFGSYVVAKELWEDIEEFLVNLTAHWRIKYVDREYFFKLEQESTISRYYQFSRNARIEEQPILPDKIDFVEQSTSKSIEAYISKSTLSKIQSSTAHLLSLDIKKEKEREFFESGFIMSCKIAFNKMNFGLFILSTEYFQAMNRSEVGTIDKYGKWIKGKSFWRRTLRIGRIKIYLGSGMVEKKFII